MALNVAGVFFFKQRSPYIEQAKEGEKTHWERLLNLAIYSKRKSYLA